MNKEIEMKKMDFAFQYSTEKGKDPHEQAILQTAAMKGFDACFEILDKELKNLYEKMDKAQTIILELELKRKNG